MTRQGSSSLMPGPRSLAPRVELLTIVLLLILVVIQAALLKTLTVYNTLLGNLLLIYNLLLSFLGSAVILSVFVAMLYMVERVQIRQGRNARTVWIPYFLLMPIIVILAFFPGLLNAGLGLDVQYTWILNKAGLDSLSLTFLQGWTIVFTVIFAVLFILSDPRILRSEGMDGRRHLYVHSKVIGILRTVAARDRFGRSADHALRIDAANRARLNDLVRLYPYGIGWTGIKLVAAFIIGAAFANQAALRYLVIQNFLPQSGSDALGLIFRYLSFIPDRAFSFAATMPQFPIEESFTFEVFRFLYGFIGFLLLIWGVRLSLFALAQFALASKHQRGHLAYDGIGNGIWVAVLFFLGQLLLIPTWVFDRGAQYGALQVIFAFIAFLVLGILWSLEAPQRLLLPIVRRDSKRAPGVRIFASFLIFILLVSGVLIPSLTRALTVDPYMQGKRFDFSWVPAYLPTIAYTRWAFQIDNIQITSPAVMGSNSTEILDQVRIFNSDAARLNMRPQVGVNWMSMDGSDIDIIYLNGHEYWTSVLTLVRPPYSSDVDQWRTDHLLITHAERMLAVDAATTQFVNISQIFNWTQTPQIYYGEGGLWRDVREVYLNISNFKEAHLATYQGPAAYNAAPDYTYSGFWRWFKFIQAYRWDFAQGDYGDIKTLVTRDVSERVHRVLIPGLQLEPDAYPVFDDEGNIYLLYWSYINWSPPHDYLDYPEHAYSNVIRKFAVILVNLKDGAIDGYLMDTERTDYILSFYRSFYSIWNKPVPDWLTSQLRYPESFLKQQIDAFNFYFQTDFNRWQRNDFYELTQDQSGNVIEDVRYIVLPLDGTQVWAATRIVELYQSPSRNLAGLYIAPGQADTGTIVFVDLTTSTFIGPATALSTVGNNEATKRQLTLHPNWTAGNMLLYSIAGNLYYVIPYYAQATNFILPAMVVVVDAQTQKLGYYVINNPQDPSEVGGASGLAFSNLGLSGTGALQQRINDVVGYIQSQGFSVEYPESSNPNVSYNRGNSTYHSPLQWNSTRSFLLNFLNQWAVPNNATIVNLFTTLVGEDTVLRVSVQYVSSQGVTEQFALINVGK